MRKQLDQEELLKADLIKKCDDLENDKQDLTQRIDERFTVQLHSDELGHSKKYLENLVY